MHVYNHDFIEWITLYTIIFLLWTLSYFKVFESRKHHVLSSGEMETGIILNAQNNGK